MALTKTEVSELYVAIFNRASEGSGNTNWQNQNLSMAETANLMLDSGDAKKYFGDSFNDNKAFIEHIYLNTLGKTAEQDPDGIQNWVNALNGGMDRGELISKMIDAINTYSDSTDPVTKNAFDQFQHRVNISDYTADHFEGKDLPTIMPDYGIKLGFKNATNPNNQLDVDEDGNTVGPAEDYIDGLTHVANPINLTAKIDNVSKDGHILNKGLTDESTVDATATEDVKLTSGNDQIKGEVGTLQTGDSIVDDSTDDHDTLVVKMNSNLGTAGVDDTKETDPEDGPTITNIEEITFNDDPDEVGVMNISNITGTKKLIIDSDKAGAVFTSDNDNLSNLEIRGLDGDEIEELVAGPNRTNMNVSEIEDKAVITLHDNFTSLGLDALDSSSADESLTVNMKGADFTVGLYSDSDDDNVANDGGELGEITFNSADNASTITIATGTALHNATDATKEAKEADTAPAKDDGGTEGSVQTIAANDGITNSNLAASVILKGDQDITIKGTAVQLDEAIIKEADDDTLTSTIDLTIGHDSAATEASAAMEIGHPIDLTAAEVDRVIISAQGDEKNVASDKDNIDSISEYMEVNVDENTIAEVTAITRNDALIITGDSKDDTLQIEINTGTNNAASGTLILGGDGSATTSADTKAGGAGAGDGKGGGSATPDTTTANADTAEITVMSNSNLEILDVSQLTSKSFSIKGDKSLTIDELVMGSHGPHATDDTATYLNAKDMTGSLTVNLSVDNKYVGTEGGHDDGNGRNADVDGADNLGSGNQLELGSGRDFVGNAGVVSTTAGGYDYGDNIHLGAGNDTIEIGSIADEQKGIQAENAVSVEIVGGAGDDTFVFQSTASTDEGQLKGAADGAHQTTVAAHGGANNSGFTNQGTDETGVSLVRIKDFEAGANGDVIKFNLFHDYGVEAATTDHDTEANGSIYNSGEIISATSDSEIELDDGNLVFVSVGDINDFDATNMIGLFSDKNAAATEVNRAFADQDVSDADTVETYDEYIFVVGETSGNDGVKIFYVREGFGADDGAAAETTAKADDIGATLIGQVFNDDAAIDFNIATLDDANFAFL